MRQERSEEDKNGKKRKINERRGPKGTGKESRRQERTAGKDRIGRQRIINIITTIKDIKTFSQKCLNNIQFLHVYLHCYLVLQSLSLYVLQYLDIYPRIPNNLYCQV